MSMSSESDDETPSETDKQSSIGRDPDAPNTDYPTLGWDDIPEDDDDEEEHDVDGDAGMPSRSEKEDGEDWTEWTDRQLRVLGSRLATYIARTGKDRRLTVEGAVAELAALDAPPSLDGLENVCCPPKCVE
jgi:hypothetical protein